MKKKFGQCESLKITQPLLVGPVGGVWVDVPVKVSLVARRPRGRGRLAPFRLGLCGPPASAAAARGRLGTFLIL